MAWLDDRAWCHPKLVNLSDKAHRVYINSISYSSGMGLRGVLTSQQQQLIGSTPALRRQLIESGLWDELVDGIGIHDWDDHNSKRDDRREKDRLRKREARAKERPQDSPQDVPMDAPHSRRALKEVKVVKEVKPLQEREPDELWDTLVEELGDVETKSERGKRNAAVKELRDVGATPVEIRQRCAAYRQKWPHLTLTATALTAHWSSLVHVQKPQNGAHAEVDLDLPEISEEERLANLKRLKAMTS